MNKAKIARAYGVSRPTVYKMLGSLRKNETPQQRFGAGECITLKELCALYGMSKSTMILRLALIKTHVNKHTAGIKRYTPKQVEIIIERLREIGYEPLNQNQ